MTKLTDPATAKEYALQVAKHRGWIFNPDNGLTDPIVAGLATQATRYGKPYCPCRDIEGKESDQDLVCPCAYAAADIAQYGQCFCGLYLAPDMDPKRVGSIPERRP